MADSEHIRVSPLQAGVNNYDIVKEVHAEQLLHPPEPRRLRTQAAIPVPVVCDRTAGSPYGVHGITLQASSAAYPREPDAENRDRDHQCSNTEALPIPGPPPHRHSPPVSCEVHVRFMPPL